MFYNFKGGLGGGGGLPLYHSYRILRNIKSINLYIWQVGKCPGHPLRNLNFLDLTLNFISFIKRDLMAHGICVSFNIKKWSKALYIAYILVKI